MPDPLQATISLLLSINVVPSGCESYALAALLEIDRLQEEMIHTLRGLMAGGQLAREFHHHNLAALEQLDKDWPHLRSEKAFDAFLAAVSLCLHALANIMMVGYYVFRSLIFLPVIERRTQTTGGNPGD